LIAKENGARLVIVNRDPTDFDEIADLVVREDIGTVLAPFIDDASSTDVHRLQ
jgi:NAD-dependent deacetylase